MTAYQDACAHLKTHQYHWLVTGVAGFIGSNLLEKLLSLNQKVSGLDNFSTGHRRNLEQVRMLLPSESWDNFNFIEGDIRNLDACTRASEGVDFVLHQAALGSVPRSIANPIVTNESNITGFLNILVAGRNASVRRFVYAASSSTYGDHEALPKIEDRIGKPLSPYAVTKYVNELYADVFGRCYGMQTIGLRYFNVFGPRQDPHGAYAAVIPQWSVALIKNQSLKINGDGETTRDFCFVDNVVQANILAALAESPNAVNQVYNVAVGERTSLNQLYQEMRSLLMDSHPHVRDHHPQYQGFREGDIRHSLADISKATQLLGYKPSHRMQDGLKEAMEWYKKYLVADL